MSGEEEVKKPESLLDLFKYIGERGFEAFKNIMLNETDKKDLIIYAGLSYLSHELMTPLLKNDLVAALYGPVALKLATSPAGDNPSAGLFSILDVEIPFNSQSVGLSMLALMGIAPAVGGFFKNLGDYVRRVHAFSNEMGAFKDKYWSCMLEEDRVEWDRIAWTLVRSPGPDSDEQVLAKAKEDFGTLKSKVEGYCSGEDTQE